MRICEKDGRLTFLALWTAFCLFGGAADLGAQPLSAAAIQRLVAAFKDDPRGPYQGIRWFCPDGSVRPAQEMCPGGHQHALVKDAVARIAQENGVYLGQILTDTPFEAFWDSTGAGSRLKQYVLERFLQGIDDGWIVRQARFYRGAVQVEDEEAWSRDFLIWALSDDRRLSAHYFLLRQACADLPHGVRDNRVQAVRALARAIGDSVAAFMPLRIKIHGQPDVRDLDSVRAFRARHLGRLSGGVAALLDSLETQMAQVYAAPLAQRLVKLGQRLPFADDAAHLAEAMRQGQPDGVCRIGAALLLHLREAMAQNLSGRVRLQMMDLSLAVEDAVFQAMGRWQPDTPGGLLEKARVLLQGATGCGDLESWEWAEFSPRVTPDAPSESVAQFVEQADFVSRAVTWGTGMVRVVYDPAVRLFTPFEPLAGGFVDDRVRASLLLGVGDAARHLRDAALRLSGSPGRVMGETGLARGLNPGFAQGTLRVVRAGAEGVDFEPNDIYALQRAPAEMKPAAGILTVSEGNAVSHVQLLARNLGIPNAVIAPEALDVLEPFAGAPVFFAVSPRGVAVMKPVAQMTPTERALFDVRKAPETRIAVPMDRIDLSMTKLPSLLEVRASDSGVICGPKAANLGELRSLFPDHVAPGVVIPFGVFRAHMDQPMPGTDGSYWAFLQTTFTRARALDEAEADTFILERLAVLRRAIQQMAFPPWFLSLLADRFAAVFGDSVGQTPVFVRSDTNMEDLKDFTGAGLNLTVPNVVGRAALLQAIRDVWASPFTERSYRWRQKYLQNPEQVFPSILLLRSVPVDKSGVMITTGLVSGDAQDVTVAFSRGVGGAVEGQAAETYLLKFDGADVLLMPAREPRFTVLPDAGGAAKRAATFEQPVLGAADRTLLRGMAQEIRTRLSGMPQPFDVELGFLNDKIYLFQVRPFVESKRAQASVYLNGLDAGLSVDARVELEKPF